MSERVTVESLKAFVDPRGIVFEPLLADAFTDQKNAHVVITEPGQVRGNHRHPRGREVCVVMGPALVRVKESADLDPLDFVVEVGAIERFVFPPGVSHAIQNTGSAPQVLVSFNTVTHDSSNPDVEREVLILPPS